MEKNVSHAVHAASSLTHAIWCLIKSSSYEEAVLKAVNLGDDTDTVGAVTGGLAGLYYGYDCIPDEWKAVIQRKEWIDSLIDCSTIVCL